MEDLDKKQFIEEMMLQGYSREEALELWKNMKEENGGDIDGP